MKRSGDDSVEADQPRKLMSVVGSVTAETGTDLEEGLDITRPNNPRVHSNPDAVVRNKRLFGNLMGHLGRAKKNLENDSSKIELQESMKSVAVQKNMMENQRLLNLQQEHKMNEKQKVTLLREASSLREKLSDVHRFAAIWREEILKTQQVILTIMEPRLSWMPVQHNTITTSLLTDRAEEVARLIAERDVADDAACEEIEGRLKEIETEIIELEQRMVEGQQMFGHSSSHSHHAEEPLVPMREIEGFVGENDRVSNNNRNDRRLQHSSHSIIKSYPYNSQDNNSHNNGSNFNGNSRDDLPRNRLNQHRSGRYGGGEYDDIDYSNNNSNRQRTVHTNQQERIKYNSNRNGHNNNSSHRQSAIVERYVPVSTNR